MKSAMLKKAGTLAGLVAAAAMALTACSSDSGSKPTLVFADLNWSTALLQNAIARHILEKGYGYETDAVEGSTIPLMQALTEGDLNVSLEIWLPNQQAAWEVALREGAVEGLGESLADSVWQSAFIIPKYTADANPGLRSIEDLRDERYWSLFKRPTSGDKAGLVTCIPGWSCEVRNEQQLYGYGLQDVIELINPGSFESLNSEIVSAFENREDILFYYWGPTELAARLNADYGGFVRLEEPPSTPECEQHLQDNRDSGRPEDVAMACEYANDRTVIAIRAELRESAPDAVAFLENWSLSGDGINSLLVRLDETGDEYADVAAWWLRNSDEWQEWVSSDIADTVLAAL